MEGLSGNLRSTAAKPTARRRSQWKPQGGGHLSTRKIGPEGGDSARILSTALLPPPGTLRQQNTKTGAEMDKSGTGSVLSTSRLVDRALTRADLRFQASRTPPLRCRSLGLREGVRLIRGPPWKKPDSPFVSSYMRSDDQ
jgi:hypothetical protein